VFLRYSLPRQHLLFSLLCACMCICVYARKTHECGKKNEKDNSNATPLLITEHLISSNQHTILVSPWHHMSTLTGLHSRTQVRTWLSSVAGEELVVPNTSIPPPEASAACASASSSFIFAIACSLFERQLSSS